MSFLQATIQRIKSHWVWLKWPVALLLLGYLFYSNRQALAGLQARTLHWNYLAISFVLCSASITLTFCRWYLLVWAQDFPFTLRDALRLGFIGYLFNYVAPGSAGGDLFKAGMIATEQKSRKAIAAATVLLDRLLGMLALFMVGALASFFLNPVVLRDPTVKFFQKVLFIGSIGGTLALALALHPALLKWRMLQRLIELPKVGKMIAGMINAVRLYQARGRVLVLTVLISIVGHFGMLSSFYFCSQGIEAGKAAPGYWANLMLIPGAELAAVVIPLPGGMGALEGAVQKCYVVANSAAGMPVPEADAAGAGFTTALAYRLTTIVIAAIGAGYYLTSRSEIGSMLAEQEAAVRVGDRA